MDGEATSICAINPQLTDEDKVAILKQHDFSHVVTDLREPDTKVFLPFVRKVINPTNLTVSNEIIQSNGNTETLWLVPTSGTTALPKLVVHSLRSLSISASAHSKSKNADKLAVWGLFYDITRYAGYQVFFQSLLSGGTLVVSNQLSPVQQRVNECLVAGVTHISATPTMWRKILMCPGSQGLKLEQIVLGGEEADQRILSALKNTFPSAKITHVYASTEAGVGLSVSDVKAGFPMSFTRESEQTVQIQVRDERLFMRSSASAQKYASNERILDNDGWIDTGDMVRVEEGRFYIIGRSSGILNVGGDKVIPEQIRQVLLQHKFIEDAVVYGKKNPFTGVLVMADVELKKGIDEVEMKKDVEAFLQEMLSSNQRPRILKFVKSISTNLAGKVMP